MKLREWGQGETRSTNQASEDETEWEWVYLKKWEWQTTFVGNAFCSEASLRASMEIRHRLVVLVELCSQGTDDAGVHENGFASL